MINPDLDSFLKTDALIEALPSIGNDYEKGKKIDASFSL